MSGMQQLMIGAGGQGVVAFGGTQALTYNTSYPQGRAYVSILADGSTSTVIDSDDDAELSDGDSASGYWHTPIRAAAGATYYVKCTVNSGTALPSYDATGTWLPLTTSRTFGKVYPQGGSLTSLNSSLTISIARSASDSAIVASVGPFTLQMT